MSPSLNDFSRLELETLLSALASYSVDLKNKIELCDDYDLPREVFADELERVNLIVVQTINAKVEVVTRERIQSN